MRLARLRVVLAAAEPPEVPMRAMDSAALAAGQPLVAPTTAKLAGRAPLSWADPMQVADLVPRRVALVVQQALKWVQALVAGLPTDCFARRYRPVPERSELVREFPTDCFAQRYRLPLEKWELVRELPTGCFPLRHRLLPELR
jgi:hypothetical protein